MGMMRRKRNTISVFTSRVMSHSDSRPYCLGFLGRHRSHVRRSRRAEELGSNSHCMDTRQKKAPRRCETELGQTLLTPSAQPQLQPQPHRPA